MTWDYGISEGDLLRERPDLAGDNLKPIRKFILEGLLPVEHLSNFIHFLDPTDANGNRKNYPDITQIVDEVAKDMGFDFSPYADRDYRISREGAKNAYPLYKEVLRRSSIPPERLLFGH